MTAVFGASPSMVQLRMLIKACARSTASVLIQGETGSGKEVICRELHRLSPRCNMPLVALNCAAIPATLLESELFGYRKGAYTGAITDRKGRLELAHGGTLFLDEIGDMPLDLQAKLLRFLEDRVVEPLGGAGDGMVVDVRVIAATHKNLPDLVQARQFREDLFYRLNVVPLAVPPLRERGDELPVLCRHFAELHAGDAAPIAFTDLSLALLADYDWPGNVRELSNILGSFIAGIAFSQESSMASSLIAFSGTFTPATCARACSVPTSSRWSRPRCCTSTVTIPKPWSWPRSWPSNTA